MVILYKDKNKSLIYDYSTKTFKVVTLKGKYEIPAESIIRLAEKENLEGIKKDTSFEEGKRIFSLSLKVAPKREEKLKEQLQKYDAKVVVNGKVEKLDIPGIVSLAKNSGLSRERVQIFLTRVIHYLIEKYYRNGDIPSLKSLKKIVRNFCEIERIVEKAEKTVNDMHQEEGYDEGNRENEIAL